MEDLMGGTTLLISKTGLRLTNLKTPPPPPLLHCLLLVLNLLLWPSLYLEILLFSCEASTARVLIEDNLYPKKKLINIGLWAFQLFFDNIGLFLYSLKNINLLSTPLFQGMELLRELYHVLLAVAFLVSSTLGAKDKELYCGGKFYMPAIINFRLQLTHSEINTLSTGPNFL